MLETVRQGKVHVQAVDGIAVCSFATINKSETEPSKKRPIGAGTGPRCFAESFITTYYQSKIAELILPENFFVAVDNECPLLAFTTQEELLKFVHREEHEIIRNPPTHVGIATDTANMFNTKNEEECAQKLAKLMPALYPMYTNVYSRDLYIW